MNQIVRLNHERDFDILFFLWKWKLAPSIVIFRRFFEQSHFTTAYNRLRQLEQAGLIRSISIDKNHGRLWTLEDLGFRSIKHLLPDLAEEGYKSENLVHDLLVNSVLTGSPKTRQFST